MTATNQYFEGILQLRNPTREIEDFVAHELANKAPHVWVSKVKRLKNGADYYISSNKALKALGKKLDEKFSGDLVASRKLHSTDRQTGKQVYRGVILFKCSEFQGDKVFLLGQNVIRVKRKLRNRLYATDLETGKDSFFEPKNLTLRELPVAITQIVQLRPMLQVLHPETYQNIAVKNPLKKNFSLGQKVGVAVLSDRKLYML